MSQTQDSSAETSTTKRRTFMAGLGALAGSGALGQTTSARESGSNGTTGRRRNVILTIPDGGSRTHDTAARYLRAYENDASAFPANIEDVELGIDRAEYVGSMSTYPDDPEQLITDSGAAATAMATGQKSYTGAISVDHDGRPIETILERASDAGYATGLVTTTQMTHATPAAFAAHVEDRGQQADIACQYVRQSDVDVFMGGDRSHFRAEERDDGADLIGEARDRGYQYLETASDLESVDDGKVLGLFSETGHFEYAVDRQADDENTQPGLPTMTEAAIDVLEARSEQGFFLLVEGGRIDHAGHANDPAMLPEQLEHDEAVEVAMDYAGDGSGQGNGRGPTDTLVVNVADHETGGLVLGRDSYDMNWEYIAEQSLTQERLASELEDASSQSALASTLEDHTGIDDLSEDDLAELEADPSAIEGRDSVVNRRAGLAWGSDAHTATDVPIYAKGDNAAYFGGHHENDDLFAGLEAALGLR
ncbi:alkaline phosphatase [Natronorubrum daqingense]|uniref:Alkaline phosphatase n=1 Tax=Natronorubrum daqingense TaxID=588898 RepID=A0A1N7AGT3_9EURY|nr:alkaline phosphatase [Natronorubrum daqingense]APX97990.1 hypothetical protein BB347_15995 [Natronorubrum daqingense]SIR38191.1 alkaline phosphatase [Natronorubrum daqingense]